MRLDAFRGDWNLTRRIEDRRAGRCGHFTGSARFLPMTGGLDYREEGMLTLGGAPFRASRRYLWSEPGAGTVELRFADGRFFHRFRLDAGHPAAEHPCGDDLYRVAYDFSRWPCWRAEWRVIGPAKAYTLVSEYRPTGQGEETTA